MCGLVGVAAVISHDTMVLLAVAAGSGWTLSIALAALYNAQRRAQAETTAQMDELRVDVAEARRQASEWSTTANNVSSATRSVLEVVRAAPAPPQRRARARPAHGEEA